MVSRALTHVRGGLILLSLSGGLLAQTSTSRDGIVAATSSSAMQAEPPAPRLELFSGSRDTEKPRPGTILVTMREAIELGLKHNLGLFAASTAQREAEGSRLIALSELLPHVDARVTDSMQRINLAAFGFTPPNGQPSVVGPFNIVDARANASVPVINISALDRLRSSALLGKAAQASYSDSREIVVLVVANLYLQTMADASRVAAARAELETATDVLRQTQDLKSAGVIAAIDVLRAQVEQQSRKQRLLAATADVEKAKLSLARAIGVPLSQPFRITETMPYVPLPPVTVEEEIQKALSGRFEYRRAEQLIQAAQLRHQAARAEHLPSLDLSGDYGGIGRTVGDLRATFTAAATLRLPVFAGGRTHGEEEQTDALLAQRRAELEEVRGRIEQEVRNALLDVRSNDEQVQVTKSGVELAAQELMQARDRFTAGVGTSLDVSQSQEALATAKEAYISSLYADNVAKATLARSVGNAEQAIKIFLGNE